MNAIRPRSFLSPLLLGLAVTLHRKFGKKEIIQMLDMLGFCASYNETLLYEASVAEEEKIKIRTICHDKADFNTNNLRRIDIITPSSDVDEKSLFLVFVQYHQ